MSVSNNDGQVTQQQCLEVSETPNPDPLVISDPEVRYLRAFTSD
ncbi:hypothetical protein VTN00DRAFT_2946 [Thermoascus crustaceus]